MSDTPDTAPSTTASSDEVRETKISWATHTLNLWSGCTKISPGCKFCYAEKLPPGMRRAAIWGTDAERKEARDSYWLEPLRWDALAEADPSVEIRVFIGSTMDVGEDRADLDPLRDRMVALSALTPHIAKLLLTKRPEYLQRYLTDPHLVERVVEAGRWFEGRRKGLQGPDEQAVRHALRCLWIGFTAEDQEHFDARIEANLATTGACHFVSYEPALGPLDIAKGISAQLGQGLDWVLAGGESGHHARPAHPRWFTDLRDQCKKAGIIWHFKQWGEWAPGEEVEANGTDWVGMYEAAAADGGVPQHTWRDAPIRETARRLGKGEIPHDVGGDTVVLRVGKAAAGHLLDGVEHLDVPTVGAMKARALLRYQAELMERYHALQASPS
jgi:protein gp37